MSSSSVYTVTAFSQAIVPKYRQDERWLEGLWGVYTSQKAAEKTVFNDIIAEDVRNYKILYENDINVNDSEAGKYCACGDEIMRFKITYNDTGGWVIKSVVSIARCNVETTEEETEEEIPEETWKALKKYGAKTPEAKAEAAALRGYELERHISDEEDWIFIDEYGWFKKEWAEEDWETE